MTGTANRVLIVHLLDRIAGRISRVGDGDAPKDWRFAYDADYLAQADAIPLSISLPLQDEPHQEAVVRNWFCNLLPEGDVREAITQRLRLDPRDDFALLAAIGGECAGAVSISDPEIAGLAQAADGEDLEALLSESGVSGDGDWALLATPRRLSLAGAQDKLAVVRTADGRLRMPHLGELKYESQGGPSLKHCAGLVRDQRLGPVAVQGFLDWVAFNVLLGNADAHAKNLALLYESDGRLSFASFTRGRGPKN